MNEDHELSRKALSRDPVAIDHLLERHLPALRAFVRLRAGPTVARNESSSDVVQSVCREILMGAGRFEYQGEAANTKCLLSGVKVKSSPTLNVVLFG